MLFSDILALFLSTPLTSTTNSNQSQQKYPQNIFCELNQLTSKF